MSIQSASTILLHILSLSAFADMTPIAAVVAAKTDNFLSKILKEGISLANIAIFLYPHRVGIARLKAPGKNPSFSSPIWKQVEDSAQYLREPMLLASLVKELVGEEKGTKVWLNLWPGAYKEVMFSFDPKRKGDLKRLRQSELETVFHGQVKALYTYDQLLDNGKANASGRNRRIIYTLEKATVNLLREAFSAQKLQLQRIAPMDAAAAEAALEYWKPEKKDISVCMLLDEACTSAAFFQGGKLCAQRTLPGGFAAVLDSYMDITGQDLDTCLDMLRSNGVIVPCEKFDMSAIQDDVMRVLNRLCVEVVKTLHNTFGEEAVMDHVLLCGNFARTLGLTDYLKTMLNTHISVAGADTLASSAPRAIALEDEDVEALFPLAATADQGADFLWERRKAASDRRSTILVCGFLGFAMAAIMSVTPYLSRNLQQQLDQARATLEQPEYQQVQALMDEKAALVQQKENLIQAIADLPHGDSRTGEIIETVLKLTGEYGSVSSISMDQGTSSVSMNLVMPDYTAFLLWQEKIGEDPRFSFVSPPSFSGSGMNYAVSTTITVTGFDVAEEGEE